MFAKQEIFSYEARAAIQPLLATPKQDSAVV